MGEDVLYSGTVSAAMEAVTLGVPGIGISFTGNQPEPMTHTATCWWAGPEDHQRAGVSRDMLLNINLPGIPPPRSAGSR